MVAMKSAFGTVKSRFASQVSGFMSLMTGQETPSHRKDLIPNPLCASVGEEDSEFIIPN